MPLEKTISWLKRKNKKYYDIYYKKKGMRKIIRLTESELHNIVNNAVMRILKEDVLGNDWHENEEDAVMNNYEPFESQEDEIPYEHDWGVKGEDEFDPTHYDNFSDDIVNGNDWDDMRIKDHLEMNADY